MKSYKKYFSDCISSLSIFASVLRLCPWDVTIGQQKIYLFKEYCCCFNKVRQYFGISYLPDYERKRLMMAGA
jgi:hypothetical protein